MALPPRVLSDSELQHVAPGMAFTLMFLLTPRFIKTKNLTLKFKVFSYVCSEGKLTSRKWKSL